jgi:hypothetical protein
MILGRGVDIATGSVSPRVVAVNGQREMLEVADRAAGALHGRDDQNSVPDNS